MSAPQAISGVNHTGVLCTMGSACPANGSRNLYDDFGVIINPVTDAASIAFDMDEPITGAPAASATDPFTAYATQPTSPAADTPEAPLSAAMVVAGAGVMLTAVAWRRRRRLV